MAAGTFTKVADSETVYGNKRTVQFAYTGNATYAAGGDALPSILRNIAGVVVLGQNTAALGTIAIWNTQTQKLQLMVSSTGVEFSGNASTFTYTLLLISGDN